MNHILILLFSTLVSIAFSQTTIAFRDGKTFSIQGEKLGTNVIYAFDDPTIKEKLVEYYWFEEDGIVSISEYSTWLKAEITGRMDELRVYQIPVLEQEIQPEVIEETDDNGLFLNYSLNFQMRDESPSSCSIYTIYDSSPKEVRSMKYVTIVSLEKEGFETFIERMKLPE